MSLGSGSTKACDPIVVLRYACSCIMMMFTENVNVSSSLRVYAVLRNKYSYEVTACLHLHLQQNYFRIET